MTPYNFLLVGRNGNGKSSTGNSILGQKKFVTKSNSQSSIDAITSASYDVDGKLISVVDGPFIKDTNINDPADVQLDLECAMKAMGLNPDGFHAVVIILKYGVRYTQQEKDAISMIRAIFGENVIKDYGICLFTYGDSFAMDNEEERGSFESWCKTQTGDIADLFKECNYRCVIFNNRTADNDMQKCQRDILVSFVEKLQKQKYRMAEFEQANKGRIALEIRSKRPRFEEETNRVIREIHSELELVDIHGNPERSRNTLVNLKDRLDTHRSYLQQEAGDTQLLKGIFTEVQVTEMTLDTKLSLVSVNLQRMQDRQLQSRRSDDKNTPPDQVSPLRKSGLRKILLGCFPYKSSRQPRHRDTN